MIEENEFWSIAKRKNETTTALQYIHSQRSRIIFSLSFSSLFWSSFLTKKVILMMMLGRYQSRVELLCRRCYLSPNTHNAINKCHRRRTTHVLKRSSSRCENSSSDTNTTHTNKIRVITKKPYHESTFVAKKSKFVCKIATISNSNEAMKFIKDHSDLSVSHNCFAWRIGDANNRSSDDGEPSGTAGIPILNVLHGKKEKLDFENVVAMVTRYYGGTKLGPGGLMRAYGGAVNQAFETLDLENETKLKAAKVVVAFANVEESKDVERVNRTVERFASEERVRVEDEEWDEDTGGVSLELNVDFDAIEELESALNEATSGRVDFKWFDS